MPEQDGAVAGRVLLVTGAGRGIGAATARQAARRGFDVAINCRVDVAGAESVAAEVRAAGRRALVVQADVADESQVLAMFDAIDRELGPVQALVNNAGIVDVACRVDRMSLARLQRMFATNVLGPFLCAREAVRRMSATQADECHRAAGGGLGGAIVNVSSVASTLGSPGTYVDYAASKGAIDTFTIGLARELAQEGVRVNAVRPGIIDTEIHASGGQPGRAQAAASLIPMRRPGRADEVAAAIVWLLSDEASYTTGAIVDVSGGR